MAESFLTKWERVIKAAPPCVGPRGSDTYENNVGRVGAALHEVLVEADVDFHDIFLRRLAEVAIRAMVGDQPSPQEGAVPHE